MAVVEKVTITLHQANEYTAEPVEERRPIKCFAGVEPQHENMK